MHLASGKKKKDSWSQLAGFYAQPASSTSGPHARAARCGHNPRHGNRFLTHVTGPEEENRPADARFVGLRIAASLNSIMPSLDELTAATS
jgi:hypothetical protein